MSFPRYPAYKPSGVEWLGEVPEHWGVKPLKTIASINDEVLPESLSPDYEIEYVDIGSVSLANGIEKTEAMPFGDAPSRARRIPRDGDVLVSTVRTYLKAIAPVVNPPSNLVASTGFAVVRPRHELEPGFLKYALQEEHFIQQVISRSTGVSYPAINASDVAKISLNLPGSSEQLAIATFLDHETAKIDALIAEQQRLIELLQEKRQSVISHAVTKGLNPDAPMKDSGVEWLGEVPEHWEVAPLMRLTQPTRPIMYGIVLPGPDVGEGVPILKGGNVKPSRLRLECMARTTAEIEAPFARARLRAGDLVYGIRGSIGDCEIVPIELEGCNITQDVARIAPLSSLCPSWLRYAMLSRPVAEGLACGSLGAAVKGINIFDLKRARIPVPPTDEMNYIADFLCSEDSRLLSLSLSAETAIALLQERRSALISAAVIGQIDVRGLVPEAEAA